MKFIYCIIATTFLFLLLLPVVFAITFTGSSEGGDTFSSTNTAQGTIAERQVVGTESSGIIFSWGAPLGNGSNIVGGDTYFITIGPVLEEEEIVKKEEGSAPPPAPAPAIPSSGGGGAGPSGKQSYGLVVGDKLTVLVKDQSHTIAIDEVGEDYVLVTIESTAQTLKITVGETKLVDLDADGIADSSITLDSVSDLRKVQITVEEIQTEEQEEVIEEVQAVEPLKRVTGAVAGLAETEMQDLEASFKQKATKVMQNVSPLVGIILLGILLGGLFTAKYVQQGRLNALSNELEKEELIQQELQKIQAYARTALSKGHSQKNIKQELLRAGWLKEEVNTALVDALLNQENKNRLNRIL